MKRILWIACGLLIVYTISFSQTPDEPPGYSCVLDSTKSSYAYGDSLLKIGVIYIQFADWQTNHRARGSYKGIDDNNDSLYYLYSDYENQLFISGIYKTQYPLSSGSEPRSPDNRAIFGSAKDYWEEISYGNFSFHPESGIVNDSVIINGKKRIEWLTAPNTRTEYIQYYSAFHSLCDNAINQSILKGWITDELDYDVYAIIYAGDRNGDGYGLWPRKSGNKFITEERRFDNNDNDRRLAGIYTFCHEFGHLLNLGDIRGGYTDADGFGDYSLMATFNSSEYNIAYERPPHLSCYEKELLGWLDPYEIVDNEINLFIPNVEYNSFAIKYYIPGSNNEYFMIENRQPIGFDFTYQDFDTQKGGGLLVYHKAPNKFNNGEFIMILEADGSTDLVDSAYGNSGDLGDFFPGTSDVRNLTDLTTPNTSKQNGNPSRFAMLNVSDSDSIMYADIYTYAWAGIITSNTTWTQDVYIYDDLTIDYNIIINIQGDVIISDSAKLTINSGAQLHFSTGKQLTVHGSLLAEGTEEDSILFTSANASPSTGDWNGIIFEENATGSLKYCNVRYSKYGVRCNYADPNIHNNTLTHNNYGIYLYYASPNIITNTVSNNTYGLYGRHTTSYIYNNYIFNNTFSGAFFNSSSSPDLYNNSFKSNIDGVRAEYYSEPKFGPTYNDHAFDYGKNIIINNYSYGLISDYFSSPFLGSSNPYNTRIGGDNSIYDNSCNVGADHLSIVEAEYNWWGSYPPDTLRFSSRNNSSINHNNPLSSSPGGGSTLSKAASTLVASGESGNNRFAGFDPKKPNPNRLSDLWLWGYDLFINNKQADAIEVYKQLISKFSGSRQAGNALVKICHMSRNTGREDLSAYLTDIIQNPEISGSLKPVALALLAGDQLFRNEAQKAVQTYETILNRYPDTKNELHALYSLVLAYHINLKDTESALKYLSVMKSKYPDEEMTLMAREEMGEKVKWSLAKGGYRDHADEKTPAIPEEYALRDNYPNPFNPYTTLAFDLPEEVRVTVTIYDITGRQVMTLTRDEAFPAGFHQIRWDGQNAAGRPVSSGVYLYAMKTSTGFQRIKKMVMVK